MTDVLIGGVRYVPAAEASTGPAAAPPIGIAVTTHNRPDILAATLDAIRKHLPPGAVVAVVDDASTDQARVDALVADFEVTALYRFAKNAGIPAAKNRCIEILMNLGVEHLFLFDDDTRPCADDWWKPYVDGPEPHYAYCWTKFAKDNKAVPKMDVLYRDNQLVAYGWSMGCLLYVHRSVVERVGGLHPGFGMGMEEHAEWSQRIHNAGLTSFVHQDHPQMAGKVWAGDEHYAVQRSFSHSNRQQMVAANEKLRLELAASDDFISYRQPRDVVLTSLFTGQPDPQRGGRRLTPDSRLLAPLLSSVGAARLVVLRDWPGDPGCENREVDAPMCAYRQRWLSQWQWLRDHPEVRFVWCVDATDVVQLNEPFAGMEAGTLYCGWEPRVVGHSWMRKHSEQVLPWISAHATEMLLNCGVVGGDRDTVMRLCRRMNDLWVEYPKADPLHEMAFFNIAAREHIPLVTGPRVTTVFKSNVKSDADAIWAHK